ncbi:MAG: glycosyltransferase WbuB [Phycisphaeraceae bacterium]|nr:MAG: glycosyltransferase WbuB [Phycisphaeraceae bacterium]
MNRENAASTMSGHPRKLLVLSHFYPPDPASVGQHMADAAREMSRRGWEVRVVTSDRGFEDPSQRYARREVIDGVNIKRVPWSSFGKKSIFLRAVAMGMFMLHCLFAVLSERRVDYILVSTSPPLCGFAAAVGKALRRIPFMYWVMDLNPDQLIVLGKTKDGSLTVRLSNVMQRLILKRADHVVPLDRFMAERVNRKLDVSEKTTTIPPWPHEEAEDLLRHTENWFREKHELNGCFVLMYSGNHGYSTPVNSMLDGAQAVSDEGHVRFMFIGGGVRKREVDERIERDKPEHIISLGYQPMEHLRYSLSAADVHLVTMESDVVGIVHPCKIYGAMAVGRPILLLGPSPCHAADILEEERIGWRIPTDDAEALERAVREVLRTDASELEDMGRKAKRLIDEKYSKKILCGRLCDLIEAGVDGRS